MTKSLLLSLLLIISMSARANDHEAASEEHSSSEHSSEPEADKYAGMKKFIQEDTGNDVKIPTKIWEMSQGTRTDQSFTFAPIKVRFQEKTKGTLIEPEFVIELPRGGGEIDLSKFVKDQQGTFRIFFDIDEMKEGKDLQIYYISKVRKRKIDGEVWGAGCRRFMDIKKFVLGSMSSKGLEVNTTRNRHLSVLGGIFFFSAGKQVTQVNFKDLTQAQLFCNEGPE